MHQSEAKGISVYAVDIATCITIHLSPLLVNIHIPIVRLFVFTVLPKCEMASKPSSVLSE